MHGVRHVGIDVEGRATMDEASARQSVMAVRAASAAQFSRGRTEMAQIVLFALVNSAVAAGIRHTMSRRMDPAPHRRTQHSVDDRWWRRARDDGTVLLFFARPQRRTD
jgi:hypothetical protein